MSNSISKSFIIPAQHPCFAGHFPGNPIVPGVVILENMRKLLALWRPQYRIAVITQVKFHQPLRPEQEFIIALSESSDHFIKFECLKNNEKLASGQIEIQENS